MNNITKRDITNTLDSNYLPYAVSVIVERALPQIDGFKPSHRKLLWTMNKMKLSDKRTKSANIVGQTMKFNPHGDLAIYATMVRLAQKDTLLYPYIQGKGNFGQHTSREIQPAASRYTEAKNGDIWDFLFNDIDKNAVEMMLNYDDTELEPKLLPTTFPNILVNQNEGIAVGMASNIPSFNLREVCDTTIKYIDSDDKAAFDVSETLKAPDFATGGYILYDQEDMRNIYETGRGSFKMRSNYKYIKADNEILITEIPFTTNRETIIDKAIDVIKAGKIKEISNITDTSDLRGMSISVSLKRGSDPEQVMAKLYQYTTLESSYSCNMNLLGLDNLPRVMSIKEILDEWIKFRTDCVERSTQYNLDDRNKKLHRLYAMKKVLLDIDKAVDIIRKSDDESMISDMMKAFKIDEEQAEYVSDIKLRNLNKDYIIKRTDDIEKLEHEKGMYEQLLADKSLVLRVIKAQLKGVSDKIGTDRKTKVKAFEHVTVKFEKVDTVDNFNCTVFITKEGYMKKIPLTSLRGDFEHKLKDGDEIVGQFDVTNKGELLVFTDTGDCYKKVLHEIDSHKTSSLGEYAKSFLGLEEEIVYMCATSSFNETLMFGFENGLVAKVKMDSYKTKTKRTKLASAYNMESPLVNVIMNTEDDVIMVADSGKVLVADQSKLNAKGKASKGFKGIKLKEEQKMIMFDNLSNVTGLENNEYYKYAFNRGGNLLKKTDTLPIDI